ncbi:hypothetical protein MATL_G00033440 [Megalops atlanticus]|uniref:TRIM8/14/16/25/29/45/65 coiled-coil region domain-containing protein n=1 Tax=Megalops atlanticus TaxID=7932 RepID=A0A9D3QD60_MEGAT|nr:hypothetical protein MATL_G00033440 [Megalops atlanticus]
MQVALEDLKSVKLTCDQISWNIKSQSDNTEDQINEVFDELYGILQKEKAVRIRELRKEEKQKEQLVKKRTDALSNNIASLSDKIKAVEKDMAADDIVFLQHYKDTKRRTQNTVQDRERAPRQEIDVAKHLDNLQDKVIGNMLDLLHYNSRPQTEGQREGMLPKATRPAEPSRRKGAYNAAYSSFRPTQSTSPATGGRSQETRSKGSRIPAPDSKASPLHPPLFPQKDRYAPPPLPGQLIYSRRIIRHMGQPPGMMKFPISESALPSLWERLEEFKDEFPMLRGKPLFL